MDDLFFPLRTTVAPVTFTHVQRRQVDKGLHTTGLLWNIMVAYVQDIRESFHRDAKLWELREFTKTIDPSLKVTHSHNIGQVMEDVLAAVKTYHENTANGMNVKPPWRTKTYRHLFFSSLAWKIKKGKLELPFARGQEPITIPIPTVIDSSTGEPAPVETWRTIRLHWNKNTKEHELHITYQ